MLMTLALGLTSHPWMSALAVLVVAQKLRPATAAVDVPPALAIIVLGGIVAVVPVSVRGFTPSR
jgi:hypothetical protein